MNLLPLTTLRKWPLDMTIFNRLSRILILRKLSGVWNFVSTFVNVNDCKVMVVRLLPAVRVADGLLVVLRIFLRVRECVSGPVAAGSQGVRSALGVRGGVEGTWTALDSAGETKGIIGFS